MASFVRDSNFRNVTIGILKKETHYESIKVSDHIIETNGLACNSYFIAYLDGLGGNGANICVLPLSSVGKPQRQPALQAHSSQIQDIKFHPFNQNILSSCSSSDNTVKLWSIANEGPEPEQVIIAPLLTLQASTVMPFKELMYHPYVDSLLCARSGRAVALYDVSQNKEILLIDKSVFGNDIQSINWNYSGNLLASTGKDKKIRLFDFRSASGSSSENQTHACLVDSVNGHTSLKGSRVQWLGEDTSCFVSTGHNSLQEREMFLWDHRNLKEPVRRERFDSSPSLHMPLFDPDTGLLTLLSRGEGSLRLYEFAKSASLVNSFIKDSQLSEDIHPISSVSLGTNSIVKNACLAPKQSCHTASNEVIRIYVTMAAMNSIQPISIRVPRKEKKFQQDLYPSSYWSAAPAALTVEDWLGGGNSVCNRVLITATPQLPHLIEAPNTAAVAAGRAAATRPAQGSAAALSGAQSKTVITGGATAAIQAKSSPAPAKTAPAAATDNNPASGRSSHRTHSSSSTATVSADNVKPGAEMVSDKQQQQYGSSLKFRNLYGVENPKTKTYFGISPATVSDGPILACNELYWAVPYQGQGGGPVYVSTFNNFGKVLTNCPLINGHKAPVTELVFNPFASNILVTASNDCTIKFWKLPDPSSLRNMSENDAILTISKHSQSIKSLNFHPTISNLLFVSSQDLSVKVFDINRNGDEILSVPIPSSSGSSSSSSRRVAAGMPVPSTLSFNCDGALCAVSCKDRCIRILDPRQPNIALCTPEPTSGGSQQSLGRNLRAVWCHGSTTSTASHGCIFSVSSSVTSSLRVAHVWDPRNMHAPITSQSVDNGSGQLYPIYDEGSGVCIVAGKGDTIIRYYETNFLKGVENEIRCEKANEFTSGREPIAGICLASKKAVDVKNCEVLRVLKLTNDSVIPISFHLSRTDSLKQYFQDDIYLPIRDFDSSKYEATSDDYVKYCQQSPSTSINHNFHPLYQSVQPAGMVPLSERPLEEPKIQRSSEFRAEMEQKATEELKKTTMIKKLSDLANQRAIYHPNPSGGRFKVDAKPVCDDDDEEIDWDNES